MKRKAMILLITTLLTMAMALPVLAESYSGGSNWSVVFSDSTEHPTLDSNFTSEELTDVLMGLQPGDDATIRVHIQNTNPQETRWYMKNDIISTLEESQDSAEGGAYTYILTYTDKSGTRHTLYSNDQVGGETISPAGEGLKEATSALKEYFYLENLGTGQGGTVELFVGLDGETQNNDYQDTLAELQLQFAVELVEPETKKEEQPTSKEEQPTSKEEQPTSKEEQPTSKDEPDGKKEQPTTKKAEQPTTTKPASGGRGVIKTGDTNNSQIWYILMGGAGIALLIAGILLFVSRKKHN